MRDVDLYKTILGLTPPWTVVDVTLDVKGQHVTVWMHMTDVKLQTTTCIVGTHTKPRRGF